VVSEVSEVLVTGYFPFSFNWFCLPVNASLLHVTTVFFSVELVERFAFVSSQCKIKLSPNNLRLSGGRTMFLGLVERGVSPFPLPPSSSEKQIGN